MSIRFDCSERATVLVRNLNTSEPTQAWNGAYRRLEGRTLALSGEVRPFLGVSAAIAAPTLAFLQDQGYILDQSEQAARCSQDLESATVAKCGSEVDLINHIESSPAPLVRFWRWPEGAGSVLCITGDLDALSLFDYFSRLSRM